MRVTPDTVEALSREELVALVLAQAAAIGELRAEAAALKADAARNSGNSSKPPSRDPATERRRQAEERQANKQRAAGGTRRRAGKQPGSAGRALSMTDTPDVVVDHVPGRAPAAGRTCRGRRLSPSCAGR
jgi:transposase